MGEALLVRSGASGTGAAIAVAPTDRRQARQRCSSASASGRRMFFGTG